MPRLSGAERGERAGQAGEEGRLGMTGREGQAHVRAMTRAAILSEGEGRFELGLANRMFGIWRLGRSASA